MCSFPIQCACEHFMILFSRMRAKWNGNKKSYWQQNTLLLFFCFVLLFPWKMPFFENEIKIAQRKKFGVYIFVLVFLLLAREFSYKLKFILHSRFMRFEQWKVCLFEFYSFLSEMAFFFLLGAWWHGNWKFSFKRDFCVLSRKFPSNAHSFLYCALPG